jgi:hypothetical protein
MIIEMDTLIMERRASSQKKSDVWGGQTRQVSVNLSTQNLDSLNIRKTLIASSAIPG